MDGRYAPLNDWLHGALRQPTKRLIPNDDWYTYVFDKLEILIALSYAYLDKQSPEWYWAPPGAFGYRHQNGERVLQEIEESIAKLRNESPFVKSGIFGDSADACTEGVEAFKKFFAKVAHSWW